MTLVKKKRKMLPGRFKTCCICLSVTLPVCLSNVCQSQLSHSLKRTIRFTTMTVIMVTTPQGDFVNNLSYYHYGFLMKDHLCSTKIYCICFVCTVNAWTCLCNVALIQSIRCRLVWMALYLEYIGVNNVRMRGWRVWGRRIAVVVVGREGGLRNDLHRDAP